MILYLDSSALVKFYVEEPGSSESLALYERVDLAGTVMVARAEVSAGLARAGRTGALSGPKAREALGLFHREWPRLVHVLASEGVVARADALSWEYELRGYDAVHLAAALVWQETLGLEVTLASFDETLWEAGERAGMEVWPESLAAYLD